MCWFKDTKDEAHLTNNAGFGVRHGYVIKTSAPKGSFNFRVPLSHIFGFCEDYDKIVYGMKHTLSLVRGEDDNAIYRKSAAGAGKVVLNKISWFMPHILPTDLIKMAMYKSVEAKTAFPVAYRMRQSETISVPEKKDFTWRLSVKSSPEKPRYVILGFQTERSGDQEKNSAVFDNVDLQNAYVMLNSRRYPVVDYDISFGKKQIGRIYGEAASFRSKFHHVNELVSSPNISPADFASLYPLFVFDVSKQSERLKTGTIDIQIKARFGANVPSSTSAYAVVISDRMIKFQSDGNKMSVMY